MRKLREKIVEDSPKNWIKMVKGILKMLEGRVTLRLKSGAPKL